jgi:hypothetical protein
MALYNDFSFLDAYLTLKGGFLIKKIPAKKAVENQQILNNRNYFN